MFSFLFCSFYSQVLTPSQEQLDLLNLQDGPNELTFALDGCVPLQAQLFVWPENAKIIVTDIEGGFIVRL